MKQKNVELININEARSLLSSSGLDHLTTIICNNKTVNVGSRTYITKRQFENCMKKETAGSPKAAKSNFIKVEVATL